MRGRRQARGAGLRGNGRLAAVVPNPGDVLLLSESGFGGVRSFSPLRSSSSRRRRKAEHKVAVTGVACSRRTRAPRLLAQHTHGRRATHLRGPARAGRRGSSRSAPPSGGEQALPACEWDVRAEGSCPGRELSALACLADRHAAAWSADGSGLEHRLLWHQATERRQQSPEAADPEGRAAHGWADRDHGEARWRQERRSFRCRRRGEQIRQRHWRGLTCAEATALPPSLHRICAPSPRSGTRGG